MTTNAKTDECQHIWVRGPTLGNTRSLDKRYCATTPQHSPYSRLPALLKSAYSNCCSIQRRCTSDGMHSVEWEPRLPPQRVPSFKSLPLWAHGSLIAKHRHTRPPHLTGISSCRVNCHGLAPMALLPSYPLTACKFLGFVSSRPRQQGDSIPIPVHRSDSEDATDADTAIQLHQPPPLHRRREIVRSHSTSLQVRARAGSRVPAAPQRLVRVSVN